MNSFQMAMDPFSFMEIISFLHHRRYVYWTWLYKQHGGCFMIGRKCLFFACTKATQFFVLTFYLGGGVFICVFFLFAWFDDNNEMHDHWKHSRNKTEFIPLNDYVQIEAYKINLV